MKKTRSRRSRRAAYFRCHVMERESFESEEVAEVRKWHFVNNVRDCVESLTY